MLQVLFSGCAYFLISRFFLPLYKPRWERIAISEKGRKGSLGSSSPVPITGYDTKSRWVSVNKTCRVCIIPCSSSLDGMWNLKTWDKLSRRSKPELPLGKMLGPASILLVLSFHLAPRLKTPRDLSPWPIRKAPIRKPNFITWSLQFLRKQHGSWKIDSDCIQPTPSSCWKPGPISVWKPLKCVS